MAWEAKLKKLIYRYQAPWTIYAASIFQHSENNFGLAVASYVEKYDNQIQIIQLKNDFDKFTTDAQFDHPYPPTKMMQCPIFNKDYSNLLATASNSLRLFRIVDGSGRLECELKNATDSTDTPCCPVTSFDWNENDVNLICTCSVDANCVIWALEKSKPIGRVKARGTISGSSLAKLIAHDDAVYDIAFSKESGQRDIFATTGSDGSVRVFDLRDLRNSAVVYENENNIPLMRLAWNKKRSELVAVLAVESEKICILDIRKFNKPSVVLKHQNRDVNAVAWSPNSSNLICSGGDDSQALVWDINSGTDIITVPEFSYDAGGAINQVHWYSEINNGSRIAISFSNVLELLHL